MTRVKSSGYLHGQVGVVHLPSDLQCPLRYPALDRILYRGLKVEPSVYARAELRGSDHRPGKSCLSFGLDNPLTIELSVCDLRCRGSEHRRRQTRRAAEVHVTQRDVDGRWCAAG